MANELMAGLLQSLLTPVNPQEQQRASGVEMTNLMAQPNPLAATLAYYMPERTASIGRTGRGLLGLPEPMTAADAILNDPNMLNSSDGMLRAAQTLRQSDPAKAAQLVMLAQQKRAEEQQAALTQQKALQDQAEVTRSRTGLLNLVQGSQLPANQKSAVGAAVMAGNFDGKAGDLLSFAYPQQDQQDRYKVVGNAVWDVQKGTWADGASPREALGPQAAAAASVPSLSGLPGIDFDQYDPNSFAEAEKAYSSAQSPEQRQAAIALLRPKLDAGEEWRNVNGVTVPWPASGAPRREADSAIAAFKQTKSNALRKSDVMLNTIDNILSDLASGKTDTGAYSVLGYVAGTPAWNQRMNVEALRANVGFSELQSLRTAAANGASGLGQLTERELSRLEALVGSLSLAQTRDQFVGRLNDLRTFYADLKTTYKDLDMTLEDYAGAPRSNAAQVGRFRIEEVE